MDHIRCKCPRISIIIPIFDRVTFYSQAIESIIYKKSDVNSIEIILVSNIHLDINRKSVRVIYTDEKSLSNKIRIGILQSSGDIIAFLEDDDLWEAGKTDSLVNLFEKNKDLDFYHNGHTFFYSANERGPGLTGKRSGNMHLKIVNGDSVRNSNRIFNILARNQASYNLSSMAIRRNFVIQYIEFFSGFGNDFVDSLVFLISASFGQKLAIESRRLTYIRLHPGNRSGLEIGKDTHIYINFFEKLNKIQASKIIHNNTVQLITRIDTDKCLKSENYSKVILLKLFKKHLIASFGCLRFPDRDIIIKAVFGLISQTLLRKMLGIYHRE
jgi:glycosyltransferase involved in cell wall biosynthesis